MAVRFLLTSVSDDGLERAELIEADTELEAVRRAGDLGRRSVRLHDDASTAVSRALGEAAALRAGRTPKAPNPAAMVRGRRVPPSKAALAVGRLGGLAVPLLVVLGVVALLGRAPWWVVALGLAGLCAVLLKSLLAAPMTLHHDLRAALQHRRAAHAAALLHRFEQKLRQLGVTDQVGPLELATVKAQVAALQGYVDDALARIDTVCGELSAPEWLRHSRRMVVLSTAGKTVETAQEAERAMALGPPSATLSLDCALYTALWLEDPVKARAALEQAKRLPLTELAEAVLPVVEGIVTLESKDATTAVSQLRMEPARLQRDARLASFSMLRRAMLAAALAEAGDAVAANAVFAEVEPALRDTGSTELLKRVLRSVRRG